MITAIQVKEENNSSLLTLPVGAPTEKSPFFIKYISGLSPVKSEITTTGYAVSDGAYYQSSYVGTRNIVVVLGYKSSIDPRASAIVRRDEIYNYFNLKRPIQLYFVRENNNPDVPNMLKIGARVESIETEVFSPRDEIQISLICPDPYFSAVNPVTYTGKMGERIPTDQLGSAPTGFVLDFTASEEIPYLSITARYMTTLKYNKKILAGDRIQISTVTGDKYAYMTRSVFKNRVLDDMVGPMSFALDRGIRDLFIYPGTRTTQEYKLTFTPKYIGM